MRRTLVTLALAVVLPWPALAAQVTVRPGETLSEIADRHGISVTRLMQINGLKNADHVEAGMRLTVPGSGGGGGAAGSGTVKVRSGETLSEIAERNGISLATLMKINGISDPDHVEVGQSLKLSGAAKGSSGSGSRPFRYDRSASVHVVRPGESLSGIADGYGVPVSKLVAINALSNPNHVEAGMRLKLKGSPAAAPAPRPEPRPAAAAASNPVTSTPAPTPRATMSPAVARASSPARPATGTTATQPEPTRAPAPRATAAAAATATPAATTATAAAARTDWRTYGPLQVDWANWQPMGGSLVAPSLNSKGQSLYLAINCSARKLNATSREGQWSTWDDPKLDFERQLVTDLCKARS
ncbi:LysM peptidoglycan-binding domain-containing protein [Cyanobium sp. FGCU-52]|nr:LysM peptidoglycan-binding domain-containing protein [Cyanobium sp. FGCU52]